MDKIHRQQAIIDKAVKNPEVFKLYQEFQNYLPNDDLSVDVLLKLTYTYDPNVNFIDQFKKTYKQLKTSFEVSDRCYKPIPLDRDIQEEDPNNQSDYSILDDGDAIYQEVKNTKQKRSKKTQK